MFVQQTRDLCYVHFNFNCNSEPLEEAGPIGEGAWSEGPHPHDPDACERRSEGTEPQGVCDNFRRCLRILTTMAPLAAMLRTI